MRIIENYKIFILSTHYSNSYNFKKGIINEKKYSKNIKDENDIIAI